MNGIDVVSFDLGHTLVFPRYTIYEDLLKRHGVTVTRGDLEGMERRLRHWFDEQVLADGLRDGIWQDYYTLFFLGLGVPREGLEPALLELRDLYREGDGMWTEAAPGASEVLQGLKDAGLRLVCVSNNDGRLADMVTHQGWDGIFELLVDSEIVGVAKPDPAIFRHTLERLDVAPDAMLHIGDYYSVDVIGARRAGVTGVLYDPLEAYTDVDCPVVQDLRELPALLDAGGA